MTCSSTSSRAAFRPRCPYAPLCRTTLTAGFSRAAFAARSCTCTDKLVQRHPEVCKKVLECAMSDLRGKTRTGSSQQNFKHAGGGKETGNLGGGRLVPLPQMKARLLRCCWAGGNLRGILRRSILCAALAPRGAFPGHKEGASLPDPEDQKGNGTTSQGCSHAILQQPCEVVQIVP